MNEELEWSPVTEIDDESSEMLKEAMRMGQFAKDINSIKENCPDGSRDQDPEWQHENGS